MEEIGEAGYVFRIDVSVLVLCHQIVQIVFILCTRLARAPHILSGAKRLFDIVLR